MDQTLSRILPSCSNAAEFGCLLAKFGNDKANPYERDFNERMRGLWGLGPDSIYNGPVGASKDDNMIVIKEPYLNILTFRKNFIRSVPTLMR